MNQSFLDLLAPKLAAHLDCTQDGACQQILQVLAETGQPLLPDDLAKYNQATFLALEPMTDKMFCGR